MSEISNFDSEFDFGTLQVDLNEGIKGVEADMTTNLLGIIRVIQLNSSPFIAFAEISREAGDVELRRPKSGK